MDVVQRGVHLPRKQEADPATEVIQPSVVHTTIPIHETHHHHAHYAAATSLPPVSMSDFKAHGGSLDPRQPFRDQYQGEPKSDSGEVAGTADELYQK